MSTWNHLPSFDWRNEGWTTNGGVNTLWECWNNDDDTKYASCPPHKGRGACTFPIDITNVPDGAVITSITVYLRCKRDATVGRSVTVNLTCDDDTSRFTSRTIYPTTTITTFEIGTYQTDPLGNPWDRNRLNHLICQLFSYSSVFDACRCYKFFVVINYHVRPTVQVTAPSGTVTTPAPVVSWTYSQADHDPQVRGEYKIFTAQVQERNSFNPENSPPEYSNTVTGDLTSFTLPHALSPDNYYIYVRVTSSFGAKSLWTGRSFTVQGVSPGPPGGGGIGTGAGAGGFVSVIGDPVTSNAYITIRDGSNLLSVTAADFEATTDYIGYVGSNCTVARDTSTFFGVGTGSLKMTASSAATMSATGTFIEVNPSTPITIRAQFKAAATGRTVNAYILFFDAAFTQISGTITATGTSVTTSWTQVTATGDTPAGAVYTKVKLEVVSPASAAVHNIDGVGIMYGTNSVWSNGGHTSRNILSNLASNGDTAPLSQAEPWVASSAAVTVTRPATLNTGSDGGNTFQVKYVGTSPAVSFVATGTTYSDATNSTGYTLNKPAGVVDNDVLVAFVASTESGTITPPAGWAIVDSASLDNGTNDVALWVLSRTGLTADPSTWVGNVSTASTRRRATVVAYRGAANDQLNFNAENVTIDSSGNPVITSSTVNNTKTGAWRISAFAVRDDVIGGSMTANVQAPTVVPAIVYVGAAAPWTSATSTSSYTINRPVGVITGDLMIASVCVDGSITTVNVPTGWTLVRKTVQSDSTSPVTLAVMKRTAGASEPTSWSSTLSSSSNVELLTQAVAYRNTADASVQFLAENTSIAGRATSITTASVANTDSSAWRISIFGATATALDTWTSTEIQKRVDSSIKDGGYNSPYTATLAIFDSKGQTGTGTYTRSGTLSESYYAAASWMGFIKPLSSAPTPPGGETERLDTVTGGSDPALSTAIYDTAGVAVLGNQSVTGVFTPGSGTTVTGTASWIGILEPATPIIAGEAGMTLGSAVDISHIDPYVLKSANNKVTFQTAVTGSTNGTPHMTLYFYNGNELIATRKEDGVSFNTVTWQKSTMTVDIPTGTTRISAKLHASDRIANDLVYFDRCALSFGDSLVYRPGTGRREHPIWTKPIIEYAEDDGTGYGDWRVLTGTGTATLTYDSLTGISSFTDQTIIPLTSRKYRVKTLSYGLAGDIFVSPYGPESVELILDTNEWWLKDISHPANSMQLKVKANPLSVGTTNTATVFQPLGASFPNVVTEGYKSDVIELTLILNRVDFELLRELLKTGRTLFLQSNMDNAWWVRPVGDIGSETQLTGKRGTNPIRFVKLQFVQVAPED